MRLLLNLILVFSVSTSKAELTDITRIYRQTPSLEAFDFCMGGGCAEIHHVALDADDWNNIVKIFTQDISTNSLVPKEAQEREYIAQAIGRLEAIVGLKTGTSTDRAGTFDNADYVGQLDCNDEAINTTTYLRLMVQNSLIQQHVVEDMRTRNFFFSGWPHTTAVIHETASGKRYAVDSWFYDNGAPATVISFDVWKSGYIPEDSPLNHVHSAQQSNE